MQPVNESPIIATTTPRTGAAPDPQSDRAALTALWSWCAAATAYNEVARQIVADAYDHLARRLGIEEGK